MRSAPLRSHVPAGGVRPPVTPDAVDLSPPARHAREIAERKAGRRGRTLARRVRGFARRAG